ncbi:DUF1775 domain-containing protein [Acidobacteria bacterium AH-259-D05]|nr:DUF1775 domain-containing protein [Acidobacteria bacterium AH-259-D05]
MKVRFAVYFLLVGSLFTAQALAHGVITPFRGTSGARHQFFSVLAPTEKDIPCVEMKLEIPAEWKDAGGQIDRVQRDPLWDITIERDEDDWIESVTWSGSEAPDYSFIKFDLIITLPKLKGMQQLKIWQKYSDGSVVGWVEDRTGEDVERPAAGLMLTEGDQQAGRGGGGGTGLAFYLGLSGLLGGLIGAGLVLIVSRKNNKKNSQ